jgi:hypothetical protein
MHHIAALLVIVIPLVAGQAGNSGNIGDIHARRHGPAHVAPSHHRRPPSPSHQRPHTSGNIPGSVQRVGSGREDCDDDDVGGNDLGGGTSTFVEEFRTVAPGPIIITISTDDVPMPTTTPPGTAETAPTDTMQVTESAEPTYVTVTVTSACFIKWW